MRYCIKAYSIVFRPSREEQRGSVIANILPLSQLYCAAANGSERSVSVLPDRTFAIQRDGGIRMRWQLIVRRDDSQSSDDIVRKLLDDFIEKVFGKGLVDYSF